MNGPSVCIRKRTLLARYRHIASAFAAAVADLDAMSRTVNSFEYNSLYNIAEAFRQDSAAAKEDLERHVTEHGC